MKWNNKGNENISSYKEHDFKSGFYVFGAGDIGRGLYITLSKYKLFKGFIDNNVEKQKSGYMGQRVYSYDDCKETLDNIIVAANFENEEIISEQLKKDNKRYITSEQFLNEIFPSYLIEQKILFMNLAQICVTERCTLHCEYCAHGCYAVDNKQHDMRLEDAIYSADTLFQRIDYIHEFVLIGGEPLLYANLAELIQYIGKNYRDKIGTLSITSNGTLIPKDDIIEQCKKFDVLIRISNYIRSIPNIENQHQKIRNLCEINDVELLIGKAEEQWWDYGFGDVLPGISSEEVAKRFDACRTPCREVRGDNLYFCVMARTVSENLKLYIGLNDCLNLRNLSYDDHSKRIICEYNLGFSDKGYLDMCYRCRGKESMKFPVPAARQLRRQV